MSVGNRAALDWVNSWNLALHLLYLQCVGVTTSLNDRLHAYRLGSMSLHTHYYLRKQHKYPVIKCLPQQAWWPMVHTSHPGTMWKQRLVVGLRAT